MCGIAPYGDRADSCSGDPSGRGTPRHCIFDESGDADSITRFELEGSFFNDSLLATVVATFATYSVIDVPCAAVGAESEGRSYCLVVGTAFCGTSL